jgi:cytochrome c peroxidase
MRSIRHGVWLGGFACVLAACARQGRPPAVAKVPVVTAAPVPACGRLHPGVGAARLGSVRAGSSVALATSRSPSGERTVAYVADADEPTLHTVDVDARQEIATTALAGRPEQVMVLADGRVAVTLRASNAVQILEPPARDEDGLAARCSVPTASEPVALAATPDDATLLVTTGWGHSLAGFDARTLAPAYEVDLPRDPRSVVVSDDGTRAFVAHVVEARMSVVDLTTPAHQARIVDLRTRPGSETGDNVQLRKGCQGFALAKVGGEGDSELAKKMVDRVFAPMVSVSPGEPGESSGYGTDSPSEVALVTVVDASAERALTRSTVLPDSGTAQGQCLLPRAAAYDDGTLFVTCLGIDSLVALDARSVDPSRAERRRWHVASGPTGVAVDHVRHRAVVWSQFDREVAIVPIEGDAAPARLAVARHADGLSANVALGRKLFHQTGDTRISSDGRACASCHPDGREDALTWSTPDGSRQTPMLAGRVGGTAPFGWLGSSPKLEEHLKKTFERLSGEGLPETELAALMEYVSTMVPPIEHAQPASPDRRKMVDRGRALFESAETSCSTCHDSAHAFTDGQRHQVLMPSPQAQGQGQGSAEGFDTPSLRFVAGTAPYFHDGRYKTLEDVLIAPDHAMGQSSHLSRQDRAALVAYLETL